MAPQFTERANQPSVGPAAAASALIGSNTIMWGDTII
jgi:hypothetical protein